MKVQEILSKYDNIVSGDFKKLKIFDFSGVYIISDKKDRVVYIGSAYARTIKVRLQQYLRTHDSGNTLGKTIAKKLSDSKKYDDEAKEKIEEAIEKIKSYKIYAIPHKDLEYKLIQGFKPKYNNCGKGED